MKIQEPKVYLWDQLNNESAHIARCARVCYASDKTTNNEAMCKRLWAANHRSMFRHAGVYFIIPLNVEFSINSSVGFYCNVVYDISGIHVSTNRQFADEYLSDYKQYEVDWLTATNDEVFFNNHMLYYTFVIETGIDITREYNRKSPNAIAERSTRYVDFIKKLGIVFKKCHWMNTCNIYKKTLVNVMCKVDEWFYKISRSKYGLNLAPQDARWCLFLDTMSKAVYTYTVKDWEYIINMRLFDFTGAAHPDAKIIAKEIKELLEVEGYTIKDFRYEIS